MTTSKRKASDRSPKSTRSLLSTRSITPDKRGNKSITQVSFIRVKFFEYTQSGSNHSYQLSSAKSPKNKPMLSPERELFVSLNCPLRLLMEYIRSQANIPDTMDFDLFDEQGVLRRGFKLPAYDMAYVHFVPSGVYFVVVFVKPDQGVNLKPQILINRGARINTQYTSAIRRQIQSTSRRARAST